MVEIQPVIPVYPVVRPAKVTNDEDRSEKRQQQEREQTEPEPPQDNEPARHIDEIV